jgi:transcriptional regulator with XRE-family HTH domain
MPNASPASASTPGVVVRRRAFGLRLRELRANADRTQASVAAEAGVDRAFYVNVENGKNNISLDKIFALADALSVDVAELFRDLDS